MQRKLSKSLIVAFLFLILFYSLTANNIFLVKADAGGTGKFLQIEFLPKLPLDVADSKCNVTATKVDSGQVFLFVAEASETYMQKVGAGTVLLEAIPDLANGWVFSHWGGDNVVPITENTAEYKTRKYGVVEAHFERKTYSIIASAGPGGSISPSGSVSVVYGGDQTFIFSPNEGYHVSAVWVDNELQETSLGYTFYEVKDDHSIFVEFEINKYTITATAHEGGQVDPEGIVTVSHGADQTFKFEPNSNYHVSAVVVDGNYVTLVPTSFTAEYTFENVIQNGHTIDVYFSLNGEADIPTGNDITVFLDRSVSLTFGSVNVQGTASGKSISFFDPSDVVVWEIYVASGVYGDQVLVAFLYDEANVIGDESNLHLYRGDFNWEDYDACDLNDDGIVNGQDVSMVANVIKHEKFNPDPEIYDVNHDSFVDEGDVHFVNEMKNVGWTDITFGVDITNNIIYGLTDHFCIFRAR